MATPGPGPQPSGTRARLTAKIQGKLLPLRRTLSRVVLVYEERHFRDVAVTTLYSALADQGAKVADTIRGLEERVILRVDILIEELWRRTESVGARQATELQRLAARVNEVQKDTQTRVPEMVRLALQMADVHQLAAEVSEIRLLGIASTNAAVSAADGMPAVRGPLLAELERGVRPSARERWEAHVKHFQDRAPVVALGCGAGGGTRAFLELAFDADVDAYGVDADPDAVARAVEAGFDARTEDPLEHLSTLADRSLGGVFTSLVTYAVANADLPVLMAEIARALQPDGVAVFEAPNPASFACYLQSLVATGAQRPASPDLLTAPALAAGLEVEECRYSPPPARHLAGVSGNLSDPGLREIADGVNELVAQLNDVLYGPQDYVLVLRKPTPA